MLGFFFGMTVEVSDGALVERYREGDVGAFEALVRRHQHRVFTLAYRWVGDAPVAEEIAQEVFLKLVTALADFRGDSSLRTWLYTVVINHCKNRHTYQNRRFAHAHEPLEGLNPDTAPRELPDPRPIADHFAHEKHAGALLREGLAALDAEQRQIILLRDVEDLDYQEIADLLHLPRGTVKSRLHRARATLAERISRHHAPEDL